MDLQDDYDRLRVEDGEEVLALLRRSAEARALCSVRAAGRPETYLSAMRALAAGGEPVLDPPRAPVIERALAPGNLAAIDLRLPDDRLSFEARVAKIGLSEGRPLLRLECPSALVRIRKRETFRVRVPTETAVNLTLDASDPALTDVAMDELYVHGGSLSVTATRERIGTGQMFEAASLRLPDGSLWPLSLRVSHAGVVRRHADGGDMRLGVQFVKTRAGFESAVARLVGLIARGVPA